MTIKEICDKAFLREKIIPELAGIYRKVFNQVPWNEHWTEAVAKKRLLNLLKKRKSRYYLLQIDSETAGSVFGSAVFPFRRLWFIHELFIDSVFQNRGYGAYLFKMHIRELQILKVKRVLFLIDGKRIAPFLVKHFGFKMLFLFLRFRQYCLLIGKL